MDASYESLQYGSKAIPHLHPERLAAAARVWGVQAAAAEGCRILDLGCAEGMHLLALALEYPQSQFVGVDASARQIEAGQRAAQELGAKNLQLVCGDLGDDVGAGSFDYVTAHGIYSWVPADAQKRLLAAIGRALSPTGIGYVGYEVFPGAYFRGAVRDALRPLVSELPPAAKGPRFRELAQAFADAIRPEQPGANAVKAEFARAARATDSAVAHDYCTAVNAPVQFDAFARELEKYELEYLCETTVLANLPQRLTPAGQALLKTVASDQIARERLLDILSNAGFRQSLIRRKGAPAPRPTPDASMLEGALLGCSAKLERAQNQLILTSQQGLRVQVAHEAVVKAVVDLGNRWPLLTSLRDLESTHAKNAATVTALRGGLFELFCAGFIDVRRTEPRCSSIVSKLPRASDLARYQARSLMTVTNQQHFPVELDANARALLTLLDGTLDADSVLSRWQKAQATVTDVHSHLQQFAKLALLTA